MQKRYKDMTPEERRAYQRERYAARVADPKYRDAQNAKAREKYARARDSNPEFLERIAKRQRASYVRKRESDPDFLPVHAWRGRKNYAGSARGQVSRIRRGFRGQAGWRWGVNGKHGARELDFDYEFGSAQEWYEQWFASLDNPELSPW